LVSAARISPWQGYWRNTAIHASMSGFVMEDTLGYLGLAILLFLIVYFLIRVLSHRQH